MKLAIKLFLIFSILSSCTTEEKPIDEKEDTVIINDVGAPVFIIEGKAIDENSKALHGVQISIFKEDSILFNEISSQDGKFNEFELVYGYNYKIEYKKTGYVSKFIEVDSKTNYRSENIEDLSVFPADIIMLKTIDNMDYSIISNKPVAKIKIDTSSGSLDYDRHFIEKRGNEISIFLNNL